MVAIEFETIMDGGVIHIPDEYREFESKNVRVTLMMDSKEPEKKVLKKRIPGTAKGKMVLPDDLEQPLDDETTELFYQ